MTGLSRDRSVEIHSGHSAGSVGIADRTRAAAAQSPPFRCKRTRKQIVGARVWRANRERWRSVPAEGFGLAPGILSGHLTLAECGASSQPHNRL